MPKRVKAIQISAVVARTTRAELDRMSETTGLKKAYIVEMALLHHFQAMTEIPPNVVIPPRLTVDRESMELIADRLAHPREPTAALRALMKPCGD